MLLESVRRTNYTVVVKYRPLARQHSPPGLRALISSNLQSKLKAETEGIRTCVAADLKPETDICAYGTHHVCHFLFLVPLINRKSINYTSKLWKVNLSHRRPFNTNFSCLLYEKGNNDVVI